jgi:hypothetical protein
MQSYVAAGFAKVALSNGWHTSKSDKNVHCTVDYFDAADRRLKRDHILKEE